SPIRNNADAKSPAPQATMCLPDCCFNDATSAWGSRAMREFAQSTDCTVFENKMCGVRSAHWAYFRSFGSASGWVSTDRQWLAYSAYVLLPSNTVSTAARSLNICVQISSSE